MIEVDPAVAEAAIKCDLNCYANQWRTYMDELRRKGNCIHDDSCDYRCAQIHLKKS